ncbi:MAG: hypothetical protein R3210_07030 [Roseovarius sp.]|nr:hypothetical protein [Roseovarius sp.]
MTGTLTGALPLEAPVQNRIGPAILIALIFLGRAPGRHVFWWQKRGGARGVRALSRCARRAALLHLRRLRLLRLSARRHLLATRRRFTGPPGLVKNGVKAPASAPRRRISFGGGARHARLTGQPDGGNIIHGWQKAGHRILRDFFLDVPSMAKAGYRFFTGLRSNAAEFVQFEVFP